MLPRSCEHCAYAYTLLLGGTQTHVNEALVKSGRRPDHPSLTVMHLASSRTAINLREDSGDPEFLRQG
jgi:hypothetical protein